VKRAVEVAPILPHPPSQSLSRYLRRSRDSHFEKMSRPFK